MWYRLSQQNIGGGAIKATPFLPVNDGGNPFAEETFIPQNSGYESLNTELRFVLEEMGQTLEEYYEMFEPDSSYKPDEYIKLIKQRTTLSAGRKRFDNLGQLMTLLKGKFEST